MTRISANVRMKELVSAAATHSNLPRLLIRGIRVIRGQKNLDLAVGVYSSPRCLATTKCDTSKSVSAAVSSHKKGLGPAKGGPNPSKVLCFS
jgi:hypothetical protein